MVKLNQGVSTPIAISTIVALAVLLIGGIVAYYYYLPQEKKITEQEGITKQETETPKPEIENSQNESSQKENNNQVCEPKCDAIGSKSQGWYDSCTNKLIRYANCQNCKAVFRGVGSSRGWYDSCLLETADSEMDAVIRLVQYIGDSQCFFADQVWCEAKQKCLTLWQEGCGITNQPASYDDIPEDKETCEARKGKWGYIGLNLKEQCNLPTSDAGKICRDGKECEGDCIADLSYLSEEEKKMLYLRGELEGTGKCSPWLKIRGCLSFVYKGKIQPELCVD